MDNLHKQIPELAADETLQTLIDTFDARLVSAQNKTLFVGDLNTRVKVGVDEYVTLPAVRIAMVERKDRLEEARASMFAYWLAHRSASDQAKYGKGAAEHESAEFIAWVKRDFVFFRDELKRRKSA